MLFAFTLICLASVGHSVPLTCEELTRPMDQLDPHRLPGRWALIAGSISYLPYLEIFRQRDSATVSFSSPANTTSISYSRSLNENDTCYYSHYNLSLEGSGFTYDGTDKSKFSAAFVHTSCRDCMLFLMTVESGKRQHFYLFSRRRQLEEKEMEEFRAQVECLSMPPPAVMDPTKDLCPEKSRDPEMD
ncbi:hypothetical protein FQA47_010696 [Oryzias melastigma]|uniref:Apolipoprotein M n=2 Tax=Oryzias melastigma TaxID=30732 RepID=A0A834C0G9_ORYME|nr:hypothetical protein FQA47_010696 [Oryzias melastigma]